MLNQPTETGNASAARLQLYFLRLTAFLSPSITYNTTDIGKDVVGVLPESQVINRKLFQQTEVYPYKQGNLILELQPGRVDWKFTYLPVDQPFPQGPEELNIGKEFLNDFLTIAHNWFRVSPPVIRLAFGAHFGCSVERRPDGYQYLQPFLPAVTLDPANSSDFQYQINRPRLSTITPGIKINRVSKWNVVVVSTAPLLTAALAGSAEQFFMAHLEVDVNTVPRVEVFNPEHNKPIFMELKDLAMEIAEKGDIS